MTPPHDGHSSGPRLVWWALREPTIPAVVKVWMIVVLGIAFVSFLLCVGFAGWAVTR